MYTLQEIAKVTGDEFQGGQNHKVLHFINDSRALQSATDTLFIALRTSRNDGHKYILKLIEDGVTSFLVQRGVINPTDFPDASFIISDDPLSSVQMLAKHHRERFNIPVIGITGSNGKTIVKEWLYQCLKDRYVICRSPKSFNSQIGVPLSILNLNSHHTLGIFEAGISQPGEMRKLEEMIRPTLGVFTSIGSAHDEGFSSREEKISEKFTLFKNAQQIIANGVSIKEIPINYHPRIKIVNEAGFKSIPTPFKDLASIVNAQTCAVTLKELGLTPSEINSKIENLQQVALRLELKNAINNSLLINDYYNSDLDSLKIALNYLQRQQRRSRKVLVVSDIEQSGISADKLYKQVANLFRENKIDQLIGIGEEISSHHNYFPESSLFFDNTQQFVDQIKSYSSTLSNATILLKGARSFGFENISRFLQQKSHDTVFEINLNRLVENVNYYRGLLKSNVQIMCMVKAMGYGAGSAEVARALEDVGVNYLAVAYADEGVELRESMVSLPVMVMSPEEDGFEDIINYRLEPEIYNLKILDAFIGKLDAFGVTEPYPVHLKIDTGMHRLGFEEEEIDAVIQKLKALPNIVVKSVFSHLVGSDSTSLDEFSKKQMQIFINASSKIEKELGYGFLKHICNSSAISRFPEAHFDMVRLGIGMYGVGTNPVEQKKLLNVGTLKSRISQIKHVSAGDTVGYSRNGKIEKDSTIATIPIGYADGFARALGNGRHGVYVNGNFCRTVGNICMDMCMIDVTGIDCKESDEVIIFENNDQINKMASALNSISYEVLTNVSERVKRIYVQE